MSGIDTEIRDRVEFFVSDLTQLIREAALHAVQEALTGEQLTSRRGAKRAGRTASPRRKAKSGRRVRRTAAQVQATADAILAHVKRNPGQRLGEIARALSLETKEARGPAFALVEAGTLTTTGQRGGTRYSSKGAKAAAPKKAGKKKAKKRKATKRKT